MSDKSALRTRMRAVRRAVSDTTRQSVEDQVLPAVLALKGPVMLYVSYRAEFPTRALLDALYARGPVAVPRITGEGVMEAAAYTGALVDGPFGIPTATGPCIEVATAVVPGLAFDPNGGRLGYGGGYYDRWLTEHSGVVPVGLCFASQRIAEVPTAAHDVRMSQVISP